MTDTPDMFECRLVGYSKQSRKDGDWVEVRFHIHPDDVTPALAQAPLKTTFMVAATPAQKTPKIEPVEKPKRTWDETPPAEQIGMRIKEPQFQKWLAGYWEMPLPTSGHEATQTDARVKAHLQIQSKTEVVPGSIAAYAWESLDQEYQESFDLIAQRTT